MISRRLGMVGRFEVSDAEYERIAPLLPPLKPKPGGRWRDHRQVLNGILYRVRTGCPWRDVAERYGPWRVGNWRGGSLRR